MNYQTRIQEINLLLTKLEETPPSRDMSASLAFQIITRIRRLKTNLVTNALDISQTERDLYKFQIDILDSNYNDFMEASRLRIISDISNTGRTYSESHHNNRTDLSSQIDHNYLSEDKIGSGSGSGIGEWDGDSSGW